MAEILEIGKGKVALFMDAEEAGYLRDLLNAHVGGRLTVANGALNRIRRALATVPRRLARKHKDYGMHGHAVLDPYDNAIDEAYALNALYNEIGSEAL